MFRATRAIHAQFFPIPLVALALLLFRRQFSARALTITACPGD